MRILLAAALAGASLFSLPLQAQTSDEDERINLKSCTRAAWEDKMAACDAALARTTNPASRMKILMLRSIDRRKNGDLVGAIADADAASRVPKAKALDPYWWFGAEHERCLSRAVAGRQLDKAKQICAALIVATPWDLEIIGTDALLSLRRGDWERAAREYKFVATVQPENDIAKYGSLLTRAAFARLHGEAIDAEVAAGVHDPKLAEARKYFEKLGFMADSVKATNTVGDRR